MYIGAKLGGSGGSSAPAVFLVSVLLNKSRILLHKSRILILHVFCTPTFQARLAPMIMYIYFLSIYLYFINSSVYSNREAI